MWKKRKQDNLKTVLLLAFTAFFMLSIPAEMNAQRGDSFWFRGYVQANPVRISAELPEPFGDQVWMEYRIQNRLNFTWYTTQNLTFHWQMRTRFFSGDLVRDFQEYGDGIDYDDGLVNLSWMIARENNWLLHYIPDRLYAEWEKGDWNVRVGRQRVNWGVTMVTNPNDIFNIYSFYDFDYPERPGSDAIRVQRHIGFASRFEIAVSPARELENSVAAALYAFNLRGYDVQFIGGYYRERLALGGGWAGDYRGAGLKGEAMFYSDLNRIDGERPSNFIIATSVDYMFGNSLFLVTELLYNGDGGRDQFTLLADEFTPDNPSFSKYQATVSLSYPIHTLVDGTMAAIWYPDEKAVFISPSFSWSVIQNLDFRMVAQFFTGSDDSIFGTAGNIVTASLKYNF